MVEIVSNQIPKERQNISNIEFYLSGDDDTNRSIIKALLTSGNQEKIQQGRLMESALSKGFPQGIYSIRILWDGIDLSYQPKPPPQPSYPSH